MKKHLYFFSLFISALILGFSGTAQVFTGGRSQSLSVCQNGPAAAINSLLSADNSSVGVTQNWSLLLAPVHGSAVCAFSTTTTGGIITPTGLTYTPTAFYTGADSFKVVVTDGTAADTTTIYVTVNPLPSAITGGTRTCIGVCIPLANSSSGGLWSVSGSAATVGSTTGVLCGSAAGGATVTYTLPTGCIATRNITVTAVPDYTGATGICTGTTTTLSGTLPGGTWLSGSPAIATVGSVSGVVSGLSVGTAAITYTSSPGCEVVKNISVSATPAAITGTSPVCVGLSTTWTNSVTGGSWSVSNMLVATVDATSGIVTGISTGTAIVTYSTSAGCFTTKSVTVVNTPGAITGVAGVCAGLTTAFSNSTTGGIWLSGTTGVATVGSVSGIVAGISAGTATISYSLGGGCVATRVATVYASPSPLSGTNNICSGASATFTSGVGGGTWSSGSPLVASVGSVSGSVSGIAAGTASITYVTSFGCMASKAVTVHALPSAGAITGDDSVCVGDTITLTNPVTGGVWSAVNTHAVVVGGRVAGVSEGIDTILYTVSSAFCTSAATHTVMVNPLPDAGTIAGSTSVCEGAAITLTNSAPGGVWSAVDTMVTVSTGGVVTGVWPGVDTILYTVTNVCGTAVARHALVVNPLPVAGAIEGSSDACLGTDITLTDTITGGVWSATTGAATVVGGIVTGVFLGIDTIVYTVTNVCGVATATKTITVNPLPFAGTITAMSTGAICPGDTVTFADTVAGGMWTTTTGAAMVDMDGLVTGVMGGIDTVLYIVTNVCGMATATHTIAVNPGPDAGFIMGDNAVCAGSVIVLTNMVTGGTWISSNTVSATVDATGVVTGLAPGTSDIYYTVTNGCGTDTAIQTVNIEIPVLPILGTSEVCPFELATFLNPSPGGTWSSSNLLVAPIIAGFAIGITPGTTTISYTINNSCGTSVATFELRVKTAEECNPTSEVTNVQATECFKVFPNPSRGEFELTVTGMVTDLARVTISNVTGAAVHEQAIGINKPTAIKLSVPPGIYFVQVVTGTATYVQKIVVE